ncbi:MAG: SLC13/DASS family transporter [Calditrichaeota bacterium]|jgi:solute carrier family 13 (sodium-dependent dicarboxylate transporter), member 2/3/5|nr:SLC13/DASS family transporter [Calditrichota bacterium]MBT7615824.1 SLC13/DASS family transporter [Calditrichota bacterium]MBT7788071.1 SLC13/DASS family transporter [Calditrichota bacterium]
MTDSADTGHIEGKEHTLPPKPQDYYRAPVERRIDWKRLFFIFLGLSLFLLVYLSPEWPDAIDPKGKHFALSPQGKAAVGLFLLAAVWWVFEVVPIGVTSITIGVIQVLFLIRPAKTAFSDFMDPSVWFIIGSVVIGMAFSKTGLTKRIAYKMLMLVGEKTSMIYLGAFIMTSAMTLIMAHTAVAAAVYPLLMAIYSLYSTDTKPTKFGQGLFIGMAFVAGAGSIITLLGAARGAVALGFFRDITGRDISFFELSYYMAPVGILMTFLLWGYIMVFFKPEHKVIPGLRERVTVLNSHLGKITTNEILTLVVVILTILTMSLRSFIPELAVLNKSAIILVSTILFFLFKILTIDDLELIPWNIILLFGGAMCIGFCLWQTGAASWIAINWLVMLQDAGPFLFIIGIAFFVLVMTNLIMNVAAIAISLPVSLVMAPYLGVAPDVILFSCLVTAGMPFLLLVGAAPNAIAYESKQFTTGKFFTAGVPASILLMIVTAIFVAWIWPMMGMPVTL